MKEQSHKADMAAALRGDFERLEARRSAAPGPAHLRVDPPAPDPGPSPAPSPDVPPEPTPMPAPEPAPVPEPKPVPSPPTPVPAPSPEPGEPDRESARQHVEPSFLSRLLRR